jgi:aspartyl-tRNA synthetase
MRFGFSKKIPTSQLNPKCLAVNLPPLRRASSNKSQNIYLVDEDDSSSSESSTNINKYTQRTHTCGELTIDNVGENVTLCGWLEFQRMDKFVVLRDSYGVTQLLIPDTDKKTQKLLQALPLETIIQVKGSVLSRPANMRNEKQQTGDVEVYVEDFVVLNKARDNLPFNIREFQKAKEALRMQYRYLDLRFPLMQRNLRVRSEMLMKMREFLVNRCGFVDVETPTLFKKTPGVSGALTSL